MKVRVTIFVIALLVSISTALGQDWRQLYDQALRDLEAGRWEMAIGKLQEAVEKEPDSGQSVTGEGGRVLRYFPYYLLGKAHFHLGRLEEASQYFSHPRSGQMPGKLAQEVNLYQKQIQSALEGEKRAEFNRLLEQAQVARQRGSFFDAAQQLRRLRQLDAGEFEARGLEALLAETVEAGSQQAKKNSFQILIDRAAEKEKQGDLREASRSLDEASRVFPDRPEVDDLRLRIREREKAYAELKEAAQAAEQREEWGVALEKLRQAAQADPGAFVIDRLPDKLAEITASLSAQAEIQALLRDGSDAVDRRDYARAIEYYDRALEKSPTDSLARKLKSRAQSLQLAEQAESFVEKKAFEDALAAFDRASQVDQDAGSQIYERMLQHLGKLPNRRAGLRRDWLDVMRNADPERFGRERPEQVAQARPNPPRRTPAPSPAPQAATTDAKEEAQRKAIVAALQGTPEEAIRMLEDLRATGAGDAELEGWTGVAYARSSLLTPDPEQRMRLRLIAKEHFRLALKLDPQHRLNPRLVAPQIQEIFSEAQQAE